MLAIVLIAAGTLICAFVVGVLFGRSSMQSEIADRVEQAYRRGRDEGEVEKGNLALDLGDHLARMRVSLQQTAEAYQQTVRAVREKLSITPEISERLAQQLALTPTAVDRTIEGPWSELRDMANAATPKPEVMKPDSLPRSKGSLPPGSRLASPTQTAVPVVAPFTGNPGQVSASAPHPRGGLTGASNATATIVSPEKTVTEKVTATSAEKPKSEVGGETSAQDSGRDGGKSTPRDVTLQ